MNKNELTSLCIFILFTPYLIYIYISAEYTCVQRWYSEQMLFRVPDEPPLKFMMQKLG